MGRRKHPPAKRPSGVENTTRGRPRYALCLLQGFQPLNWDARMKSENGMKGPLRLLSTVTNSNNIPSQFSSFSLTYPSTLSRPPFGHAITALRAYPAYIQVRDIGERAFSASSLELVKGSTCRLIMQFIAEGLFYSEVWKELRAVLRRQDGFWEETYTTFEIQAIAGACRELGLGAKHLLEADYEGESIQGWWIESMCMEMERREPVGREVWADGRVSRGEERMDEEDGCWFEKLESPFNRDWERWASPDIGSRKKIDFRRLFLDTF